MSCDYEPTPEETEAIVTEMIEGTAKGCDSFIFNEWLSTEGEMREPSKAFGWISTDGLLQLLVAPETSAQSCKDIGSEIRRRFTDAKLGLIADIAAAAAEKSANESWAEMSPSQRTSVQAAMARAGSGSWL